MAQSGFGLQCGARRLGGWAAIGFALLGACGGAGDTVAAAGGGAGGGGAGGGGGQTIACALTACEIAKLPPTGTMPTGSASYDGRASVTTTAANGALITTNADLLVNANFNTSKLAVALSNIQTGSTALAGSAVGSGAITANTFTATYTGPISGSMTGTFRGDTAAALNGEMTVTGGGATGGDAYGQFYANRQ